MEDFLILLYIVGIKALYRLLLVYFICHDILCSPRPKHHIQYCVMLVRFRVFILIS